MDEFMHYIYGFGQPCFILLTSCMKVPYNNCNTIQINEAHRSNFFTTTLKLLYWIFVQLPNY